MDNLLCMLTLRSGQAVNPKAFLFDPVAAQQRPQRLVAMPHLRRSDSSSERRRARSSAHNSIAGVYRSGGALRPSHGPPTTRPLHASTSALYEASSGERGSGADSGGSRRTQGASAAASPLQPLGRHLRHGGGSGMGPGGVGDDGSVVVSPASTFSSRTADGPMGSQWTARWVATKCN